MASKEDALKQNGCFYNNYENVAAGIFKTASFFDSRDIVQVKYEMIRAASNAESSITEISNAYGFSRKSYYQILKAFQADGLYALIPHKPGPKKPHKLTDKAAVFIDSFLESNKKAKPKESVIHSCFEWDDRDAAEKYRLQQAGELIRNIVTVCVKKDDEAKVEVRAFVNIKSEDERGYKEITAVVSKQDDYAYLLNCAKRELEAFEKKYAVLQELCAVFQAIKAVVTT